jgi:hypothetical protein
MRLGETMGCSAGKLGRLGRCVAKRLGWIAEVGIDRVGLSGKLVGELMQLIPWLGAT